MRLLLLPLLLMFALPAVGQQLYRWKDDDGVTHYTDHPPPQGRQYETREVEPDPPPPPAEAADEVLEGPSEPCLQARANLAVFERGGEVSMDLDGDGVPEKLDAAAHARELARTRELIARHCTD
jgi:hypothetical protein